MNPTKGFIFKPGPFCKRTHGFFQHHRYEDNETTHFAPPHHCQESNNLIDTCIQCGFSNYMLVSCWLCNPNAHQKSHFTRVWTLWCVTTSIVHTCNEHSRVPESWVMGARRRRQLCIFVPLHMLASNVTSFWIHVEQWTISSGLDVGTWCNCGLLFLWSLEHDVCV
jgi:hypothetical protein